jgi:hypothetical protein
MLLLSLSAAALCVVGSGASVCFIANPGGGQNSTVISLALQLHSDFTEI